MQTARYIQGAEMPDLTFEWEDGNGDLVLFGSVPHTFQLKVGNPGDPAILTKTTGIAGADTAPNIVVAWATNGELNSITPGSYEAHLIATRTSDGKHRVLPFALDVMPAIS